MATYEAIYEVGESLKNIFKNNSDGLFGENDITTSSPSDVKNEKLTIFLYQVTENVYLRNQNDYEYSISDNKEERKYPPKYLNLFYLLTPHLTPPPAPSVSPHVLLGKIIQIIHENQEINGSDLYGSLTGQKLRLLLNPLSIDDLNKIWTIVLGSEKYKLSISIEVSPVKIDSLRKEKITRVTEIEFKEHEIRRKKDDEN
jgi:hypothetical protein